MKKGRDKGAVKNLDFKAELTNCDCSKKGRKGMTGAGKGRQCVNGKIRGDNLGEQSGPAGKVKRGVWSGRPNRRA